jgi:hypothetical protein
MPGLRVTRRKSKNSVQFGPNDEIEESLSEVSKITEKNDEDDEIIVDDNA